MPASQLWRAAQEEFDDLVQAGAEMVMVLRLGAYAEVEIDPLLQYHLDQRNHTTQVLAPDGPLDFFVFSGSRRNDATVLLRNKLTKMRVQTQPYRTNGYVNRLQTTRDLRQLALDGFLQKSSVRPNGRLTPPDSCAMNKPASDWRDTEGKSPDLCAPTGACRLGLFSCIRPPKEVQKGRAHPAGVIARFDQKTRRRK